MIENDKKIRKGLTPRRDETGYQVLQDITIPAGTVLRGMGDGRFNAAVGQNASFTLTVIPGTEPAGFKRVIAG